MKARSQVKCKIGNEDRYIDCSIHDARMKSDVTLATPSKMIVDL